MAVSPDALENRFSESPFVQESMSEPVLPLRRSRHMAESVAWHTQASDTPIEQVVSMWTRQKGIQFVEEMLLSGPYNGMSEAERTRLLRYASRITAENWLEKLGYTARPSLVHDKAFAHRGLFQ